MSEEPKTSQTPTNPTEIKNYLDDKVYPILDSSLEALLRHVSAKSKTGATHAEDDAMPFSPLLWLSDHLRQYSR